MVIPVRFGASPLIADPSRGPEPEGSKNPRHLGGAGALLTSSIQELVVFGCFFDGFFDCFRDRLCDVFGLSDSFLSLRLGAFIWDIIEVYIRLKVHPVFFRPRILDRTRTPPHNVGDRANAR